jgi:AraC-like DNA-binding protein
MKLKNSEYPQYRWGQWTSMRLQLLWAYEKRMNLPETFAQNDYNFQTVALVCEGWAELRHRKTQHIRAECGEWLIFKQGRRWQRFSKDCKLLSIGYRFQLPTGEAIFDEGLPLCVSANQFPKLENEARNILGLMKAHVGAGYMRFKEIVDMRHYLLSQNALGSFLVELAHICNTYDIHARSMCLGNSQVIQALEIINAFPETSELRCMKSSDIAQRIGLSPTHMDRLMVQETGLTVHQHMDNRRLITAQDALIAKQESLKVISYTLGFSSPSHFNSWFKKKEGCTPLQYRNRPKGA